jgi:hypothetical protein
MDSLSSIDRMEGHPGKDELIKLGDLVGSISFALGCGVHCSFPNLVNSPPMVVIDCLSIFSCFSTML